MEEAAPCRRDLLLVRLGYLYGPRRAEFTLMEARDVDLVHGALRLPVLKRERDAWRSVPLDLRTREILATYLREGRFKPKDRLFPIKPNRITGIIKELAQLAGIAPLTPPDGARRRRWGVSPHRLRDFSITRRLTDPAMRNRGLEGLKAVADWHGHKDSRSTLRYLRLTEGWKEEVFQAGMGELLESDKRETGSAETSAGTAPKEAGP